MGGEELGTVIGDEHAVFDADAEFAVQVDAGLVGEDHAGLELGVVAAYQEGRFVHVEPDAVAHAVQKLVVVGAVAGVSDDLAGGGIDGLHLDTRFGGGQRGRLCRADDVEDLVLLGGRRAVDPGARDVGAIALHRTAVVHRDDLVLVNSLWEGGAVRAGGGDTHVAAAFAANAALSVGLRDELLDAVVGIARTTGLEDGAVHVQGDLVGEAQQGDLRRRLHRTAAGDDRAAGDQLQRGRGLGDGARKAEGGLFIHADRAGGDVHLRHGAAQDGEGIFVLLPLVGQRGFGLGEGGQDLGEVIAFKGWAHNEGRGGLGQNVGKQTLGLTPVRAGEVEQGGPCGEQNGVDAVFVHQLPGTVVARRALAGGDGMDVRAAVAQGEKGRGQAGVRRRRGRRYIGRLRLQ